MFFLIGQDAEIQVGRGEIRVDPEEAGVLPNSPGSLTPRVISYCQVVTGGEIEWVGEQRPPVNTNRFFVFPFLLKPGSRGE